MGVIRRLLARVLAWLGPHLRPLAWATLVANTVLVVTGGAVRLTGSGLGCPTWPRCTDSSFTPHGALDAHSAIEFGNRLLTFVLVAIAVATFLAAWSSLRRDVRLLAFVLALGIPAQAIIGGITVLTDLNPWVVSFHLLCSLAMIGLSVLFLHRLAGPPPVVSRGPLVALAWVVFGSAWVVLYLGTVVTGSGPHAGDADVARNGLDPLQASQLHADAVFLFLGLTAGLYFAVRAAGLPLRPLHVLLVVIVAQGAIGFVQYATDVPIVLVGFHMLGAAFVSASVTWVLLSVREPVPAGSRPGGEIATVSGAQTVARSPVAGPDSVHKCAVRRPPPQPARTRQQPCANRRPLDSMQPLPAELLSGPFHMRRAVELGVTRRVLERRFVRVHPRVWRHSDYVMAHADRIRAAALAMPERARLTGISRIQELGLDFGPQQPIRFVVRGDLHIAMEGVFLHRTKHLPPTDDVGVIPAAAFIAYSARARVIDAIKVGDWLLNRTHTTTEEVRALALHDLWRPGAQEANWILEHLDGRARSLPESEVRVLLTAAGLPTPELNVPIDGDGRVICDLVYRRWRTVVEHEGSQHQEDRQQYHLDIGRYAWMRRHDVEYVQSTREKLGNPRSLVGEVYVTLRRRGYDGPPPVFGERWRRLFMRVSDVIGRQHPSQR